MPINQGDETMSKKTKPLPITAAKMLEQVHVRMKLLEAKFGFKYALVQDDYGIREGTLKDRVPKMIRTPRNPDAKFGEIAAYVRPLLESVAEDELVQIPYKKYHPKSVYSTTHSTATRMWGQKSFVLEKTDKYIEIWRTSAAAQLTGLSNDMALPQEVDDAV
jgi:hypothetical protein